MASVKSTIAFLPTLTLVAAWITLPLFAAPAARAGDAKIPLEVYGRLPTLEDVVVSPDGNKVAFVKTSGDRRDVMIVGLEQGDVLGGAHVGDTKLRAIRWLDDDNLLITVSSTSLPPFGFTGEQQEWFQLEIYNVAKRNLADFLR
jgi:tricorn protease-like protein